MIRIPISKNYRANAERGKWNNPCVVCGKPVNNNRYWLHTWYGSDAVKADEIPTLDPMGDSGGFPVGAECLRQHPELREYLVGAVPA